MYKYDDKVVIDGKEVFFYSRKTPQKFLHMVNPPESLESALKRAWILMKPGMYSAYHKATPEQVAHALETNGLAYEVGLWAGKMAEKYYEKDDFRIFIKQWEGK